MVADSWALHWEPLSSRVDKIDNKSFFYFFIFSPFSKRVGAVAVANKFPEEKKFWERKLRVLSAHLPAHLKLPQFALQSKVTLFKFWNKLFDILLMHVWLLQFLLHPSTPTPQKKSELCLYSSLKINCLVFFWKESEVWQAAMSLVKKWKLRKLSRRQPS